MSTEDGRYQRDHIGLGYASTVSEQAIARYGTQDDEAAVVALEPFPGFSLVSADRCETSEAYQGIPAEVMRTSVEFQIASGAFQRLTQGR